jgi:hypothetical protein
MKILRIIGTILIFLSILTFSSCDDNIYSDYGDDTSDEAKLEEAYIYLDEGEYAKAKAILLTLDQSDEDVIRALGSSYAGTAGLDIPALITAIDNNSNSGVETIGLILGDTENNNELTPSEITSKKDDIDNAITQYLKLTQTNSVKAQLCILYATQAVLIIADDLTSTASADFFGLSVPLDKTIDDSTIDAVDLPNWNNVRIAMEYVNDNISAIDDSLSDGFSDFYNDVNVDGGSITQANIATFLNSLD